MTAEQALAAVDRLFSRAVVHAPKAAGGDSADSDDRRTIRAALTPATLPADLAEIQERADAATALPWQMNPERDEEESGYSITGGGEPGTMHEHSVAWSIDANGTYKTPEQARADAEFIAHARTDVPALVAELTAAREEITRLRTIPADAACPGCGGGGYQSSFDGSSGGTCGHCAGSGVDVDGVLIKLAELRARPTLTAEEARMLVGDDPWDSTVHARAFGTLRAIAEGAGS